MLPAFINAGLHRLPENIEVSPQSETRRRHSATLYNLDKSGALFHSLPPMLSRFYCTYQMPLDLTEDELYSGPERLAIALSQLDQNGWNTCGRIDTITWSRARCLLTPIREEILELSVGVNFNNDPKRIE